MRAAAELRAVEKMTQTTRIDHSVTLAYGVIRGISNSNR
jgi:hypothetical protein